MILELSSSLLQAIQHRLLVYLFVATTVFLAYFGSVADCNSSFASETTDPYVRPIDVAVSENDRWLVSVNASGTVALIDCKLGLQVDEHYVGSKPTAVTCTQGQAFLVTTLEDGCVLAFDILDEKLICRKTMHLGYEPCSITASIDGRRSYVTLAASGQIATLRNDSLDVICLTDVDALPTSVAVSPNGKLIGVACASPMQLVVLDVTDSRILSKHPFQGLNPGHIAFGPDSRYLYIAFTYDGGSHPSPGNIRRGWVTGSRLGRLGIEDGQLAGLTLDVPGKAVGDVLGLAVQDNHELLVTAGGTHELLRFSAEHLPWTQISGTEVMEKSLAKDTQRFSRLKLGGRPLGISIRGDQQSAFVANSLLDTVQRIDLETYTLAETFSLLKKSKPTKEHQVTRRGEAIFYDAERSLDQWYSCHTCHYNGGGNTVTFDTRNDGSTGTYKTVLPLWGIERTGPWTWHGWQHDLHASLKKSLIDSMQGPPPSDEDVVALASFLTTLEAPRSPHRQKDGQLTQAAIRGEKLFSSARAGCRVCHSGKDFTSSDLYDVGLGNKDDYYQEFSPPTLRGLYRKTMYLHHGRSKSLSDLLAGPHGPATVSGLDAFSLEEIDDLVAYLKSL
ncbi:MAG: hypothetical protein ABGW78_05140 [Pirellulales bacterium]